ncbi:MAG: phosphate acetyltransferase [Acidimicrobiales bacterium]
MPGTLLAVPTGPGVGLTTVSLGLVRALDRQGVRVGFIKPVAQPNIAGHDDHSTALIRSTTTLLPPEPISPERVHQELSTAGDFDIVLEEVVAAWQPVEAAADVVVAEGLSPGPTHLYSISLNQALARTLDAEVLVVGSWPADLDVTPTAVDRATQHVAESLAITASRYASGERARVTGCVVNRVPALDAAEAMNLTGAIERRGLRPVAVVTNQPELTWPRMADLLDALGARVLQEGDLARRIKDIAVFAQSVPGGLDVLTDGRLVIVPGDRHEVVMAACLASLNGIRLAGLLLTAGVEPDPRVWALTEAATASGLPIAMVQEHTYEAVTRVRDLDLGLPVDDQDRAELVMRSVADAFDTDWLEGLARSTKTRRLSPAAFRHRLVEKARQADARIVLPEGTEPRTVEAAVICAERGIVRSVLLGPVDDVMATVKTLGVGLPDGVSVLDPSNVAEDYVAELVELRRHKGMTDDIAREQLADEITLGTMMVHRGEVDGLVAGAAHTTADTIRPALQILRTRQGVRLVSSVFFMCLPDEVVVYGDCAINPQPDAEELADIAIQSAASALAFGIEPRVAMISFSTGTSGGRGAEVEKVAAATRLVKERVPDLAVDGPLQYDAAAIASVGRSKRPGSAVAGHANVFIFPDLDTGNTTYKAVQRSADVVSIGPMLQGLRKPVNDLSRGALVEDIVYTLALTAIQARQP